MNLPPRLDYHVHLVQEPGADLTSLWLRAQANATDDLNTGTPFSSPLSSLASSVFGSPLTPLSGTSSPKKSSPIDEALTRRLLDSVAARLQAVASPNVPSDAGSAKPKPLTAKESKRQKNQKRGSKKRRQQKREVLGQRPGGRSIPSALALKTALRADAIRTAQELKNIKTSHNGWMGSHGTKDINDSRDFSLEDVVGERSEYKMKLIQYTGP
jgi:hypothetical protein